MPSGFDNIRGAPTTVAVAVPAREPFRLAPSPGWLRHVRRVRLGLLKRSNWLQLVKFGLVGVSGYAVNLAAFALLLSTGAHYSAAAVGAFATAVTNNYTWNRVWTFRADRGRVVHQGFRFFVLAVAVLGGNLVVLTTLVALGFDELPAQAIAVAAGMPVNFVGNKLWTFSRR
jgi:putative flippase GtrA